MTLKEWLNSPDPDYWQGVRLYKEAGGNKTILNILYLNDYRYNHKLLKKEAGKLIEEQEKKEAKQQKQKERKQKPSTGQGLPPDDPKLVELYRERSMYHSQLSAVKTDGERKELAFKILDLTELIEDLLFGRTQLFTDRSFPDDRAELVKLRNNNRAYITKNRDKADKSTEVKRREEENNKIDELLKEVV